MKLQLIFCVQLYFLSQIFIALLPDIGCFVSQSPPAHLSLTDL